MRSARGCGLGLNGLLVLVILAVFIAGPGRADARVPGKKIQAAEVKLVAIYILVMPAIVLIGIAISTFVHWCPTCRSTTRAHGFTELIYAFTSAEQQRLGVRRAHRQHGYMNSRWPW